VLRAQRRVVEVAPGDDVHVAIEPAVDDDDARRRVLREADRFVDQVLVGHRLAAAHAGIRGDHDLRLRIVDPRGEAGRGKAAENHRVDRPDPHAGEHRERRLRDHRHVDQHPVAVAHALRLEHRGEAVDLGGELAEGVGRLLPRLGREVDQRLLVAARGEMTVDRVVADVGAAADEPLRERRPRVVEHRCERRLPVDQLRLVAPERVAILDGPAMELAVRCHFFLLL
jgi:hypothetical protein